MALNPLIILMVGPPGSGKSTGAQEYLEAHGNRDDLVRVSQDDQGKQGHMGVFEEALAARKDILVDRMGFDKNQRNRYLDPAKKAGYDTRIVVLHVPMETCLERCKSRANHPTIKTDEDAENAVTFFFRKYERVESEEADEVIRTGWVGADAVKCVVSDLDGTLANVDHRRHYVRREKPLKPNWVMFFEKMIDDPVNEWCRILLESMKETYPIVYATGRPGDYKEHTELWLQENRLRYPGSSLFTRLAKDHRKDDVVKEIILEFEIKTRYDILFVVDDRQQVVDMWRKHGYIVLQCAKGDF